MKFAVKIAIAALMSTVNAAGGSKEYGYLLNGADWPFEKGGGEWYCHLSNQSPIDLRTDMHSEPFPKVDGSDLKLTYQNWKGSKVTNKGLVIQADVSDAGASGTSPNNYFESSYAEENLGSLKKFSAAQFHFHAKSEHTIDGRRYDFEMHTVHLTEKAQGTAGDGSVKIFASATGIVFDRYNYDESVTGAERLVIDKFFDSLGFDTTPSNNADAKKVLKSSTDIPYAEMMALVNPANRWVYTGSLTTPPCNVGVLFNIFERVLPISEKHYNQYIAQQAARSQNVWMAPDGKVTTVGSGGLYGNQVSSKKLDVTGNWRITQKVDFHNVRYMRADLETEEEDDPKTTTTVLAILLAVSFVVAIVLGIVACLQMRAKTNKPEGASAL